MSHGNLGDDALLDLFLEMVLHVERRPEEEPAVEKRLLGRRVCHTLRHGTDSADSAGYIDNVRGPPQFVALGGGSTLHPTYTQLVASILKRYPYTATFVFGSGIDNYRGRGAPSSEAARKLLADCTRDSSSPAVAAADFPPIFPDARRRDRMDGDAPPALPPPDNLFQLQRKTFGGVRGPLSACAIGERKRGRIPQLHDPGLLLASSTWNLSPHRHERRRRGRLRVVLNIGEGILRTLNWWHLF